MSASVRPSLILNMSVEDHLYSEDLTAEIRRTYAHAAPCVVAPFSSQSDLPAENIIRLCVRMCRPYWDARDEESREQWDAVMPKWLSNMFYKVSAAVVAGNNVRRDKGQAELSYRWMEVEFGGNLTIAQATNPDSSFPSDALNVVEMVRTELFKGSFGEGVARVSVPSHSSWEAQIVSAADGVLGAQAHSLNEEGVESEIELEESLQEDDAPRAECSNLGSGEAMPYSLDRSQWGIEYTDGSIRLFDSVEGRFVE